MKADPQNYASADKADFVFPGTLRDFDKLPLEFQGYCGYHMTVHDRLLIPCVPDVGILQYNGKYYGFLDSKSAETFAADPKL